MANAVIDLVLAVFKDPGMLAEVRERPLPDDVALVIRVAANEAAALQNAEEMTGASAETLVEASVFFLQQILFAPQADSYRVLGASSDAAPERLRENYRWLMKWLHPDRNPDGWEAVHADRVNVAWQDLKTAERRAEYDSRLQAPVQVLHPPAVSRRRAAAPSARTPLLSGSTVRRLPAIVLGSVGGLAALLMAGMYWAQWTTERELARHAAAGEDSATVLASAPAGDSVASGTPVSTAGAPEARAWDEPTSAGTEVDSGTLPQLHAAAPADAESPPAPVVAQTDESPSGAAAVTQPPQDSTLVAVVDASAAQVLDPAEVVTDTIPQPDVVPEPDEAAQLRLLPDATPSLAAESGVLPQTSAATAAPAPTEPSMTTAPLPSPAPSPTPLPAEPAPVPAAQAALAADAPPPASSQLHVPALSVDARTELTATSAAPAKLPAPSAPGHPAGPDAAPESNPAPAPVATAEPIRPAIPPLVEPPASPQPPSAAVAESLEKPASVPAEPVVLQTPSSVPVPIGQSAPAPAQGAAEALLHEFTAAYNAGDGRRFERLFSAGSSRGTSFESMRRRFESTEMRFLEISQIRWQREAEIARATARYRDTYVPRGSRKAVTEAGSIRWELRLDAGQVRITTLDRDAQP